MVKEKRDLVVSPTYSHLDRHLSIQILNRFRFLAKQQHFETRVTAKVRDLTEQFGDFFLFWELGFDLIKVPLYLGLFRLGLIRIAKQGL